MSTGHSQSCHSRTAPWESRIFFTPCTTNTAEGMSAVRYFCLFIFFSFVFLSDLEMLSSEQKWSKTFTYLILTVVFSSILKECFPRSKVNFYFCLSLVCISFSPLMVKALAHPLQTRAERVFMLLHACSAGICWFLSRFVLWDTSGYDLVLSK